MKLCDILIALL